MRVTRQTKKLVEKRINKKSTKKTEKTEKKVSKPSSINDDLLKMCRPVQIVLVKDVNIYSTEKVKSKF